MGAELAQTSDESTEAKKVASDLYNVDTPVSFTATSELIIVGIPGEVVAIPDDVIGTLNRHNWTHAHEEYFDGEFDEWERSTIFAFRPSNGGV